MTTKQIPAGLMYAATERGLEFDLHSGKDNISTPGAATVTLDAQGVPVKIVWERSDG